MMISFVGKPHALSFGTKKYSGRKQKSKRTKKLVTIRGQKFKYHKNEKRGSTYECKGCQQPGFGPSYVSIKDSNVHYHPLCCKLLRSDTPSAAPGGKNHPYPTGRLVLKESAPHKERRCIACGDQVRGLRFKAEHKKALGPCNAFCRLYRHLNYRAFHPLCASLPLQLELPTKILTSQIEDPSRRRIVVELKEKIRGECLICKGNGNAKGWAYISTCGKYRCHVGCMKKIVWNLQRDEVSQNGRKKRTAINWKKWSRKILHLGFELIMGALCGLLFEVIEHHK